jgi:hypothetical protein
VVAVAVGLVGIESALAVVDAIEHTVAVVVAIGHAATPGLPAVVELALHHQARAALDRAPLALGRRRLGMEQERGRGADRRQADQDRSQRVRPGM